MQKKLLSGGWIAMCALLSLNARASEVTAVTVRVTVTEDALELSAEGPGLEDDDRESLAASLPRGEAELRELSRALLDIKRQYADSERLILTPQVALTYPELTGLMQAARELELPSRSEAVSATLPLFPEVVLEQLVTQP